MGKSTIGNAMHAAARYRSMPIPIYIYRIYYYFFPARCYLTQMDQIKFFVVLSFCNVCQIFSFLSLFLDDTLLTDKKYIYTRNNRNIRRRYENIMIMLYLYGLKTLFESSNKNRCLSKSHKINWNSENKLSHSSVNIFDSDSNLCLFI